MPSSTSTPDDRRVPARDATDMERLLAAAVRLAGPLPSAHAALGIVRGRHHTDRERAGLLRARLAEHGVRSTELSPVPEVAERDGGRPGVHRPDVRLLVHAGGSQPQQAMRTAALWQLPLLMESHQDRADAEAQDRADAEAASRTPACPPVAQRRNVIAIHLADRGFGIAVREAALVPPQPQPHAGHTRLVLDNEKIVTPARQPLRVAVTDHRLLEVRGDSFGVRRVRRVRLERAWGPYRLDVDGVPARRVRAPLRLAAEPDRLRLLHP